MPTEICPAQCRAARGLLDWSQEELAQAAGLSRSTVRDFEAGRHELQRASATLLVQTLAGAGVLLLGPTEAGLGQGVRLVRPAE
ncbi:MULTISPECIES: helix-turn-helix transcriptional regulator [Azospirillaceae]|uniref:helix-turn-helix transcriptional regulator n=1 Tax=Azospirillaceae TaxID=2829815 RepID=UPI000B714942|nr:MULTISPECIES: helix-turn-helix transcriptional regulator [Azospirillaceae]MDG5495328.1 helix-turn-helix transcriptional regulator [Niveispirillum sp. BGYR6]SNT18864.1 Helix-turn-helix [Azospirillum sp. RU38E]SNT30840.1 Helix-turn-helix [Azospirillum sp. RU37A]